MITVVIGGSRSGVGKTTLACGLVRALPELDWTAIKISRHEHGTPTPVWEETAAGQGSDTARYLAAGARRALLVTASGADLPLQELDAACDSVSHALIESNRIVDYLAPDVCLAVVGEGAAKPSFTPLLLRADAVVARSQAALDCFQVPLSACVFLVEDVGCPPPEFVAWLRGRMRAASAR
ncbi:MAG: hypothetical protein P4L40_24125 [Terracidiphilus sp.]|nr:hypothetical protein [Terracidiphilus sp.]